MAIFVWIEWLGQLSQRYPGRILLAFASLVVVALTLRLLIGPRGKKESTTHGSAQWATRSQVKDMRLFIDRGVILGMGWGHYLRDNSEGHILLVGSTRSGKGVLLNCSLLELRDEYSVVVTDPKDGENYGISHRWRRQFGPVWAFAPMRQGTWTRINVLDSIRLGQSQETADALMIAQSLVAPEKMRHESETSLHFRELAALLLTAVILHVCYTSQGHRRRRSLPGVWQFMTGEHKNLQSCLNLMRRTRHHASGAHQSIVRLTTAIQNITGDRELSSVWSTAIRPLVIYNDPQVAAATEVSDVDIATIQNGPEPVTFYLIAPSPKSLVQSHAVYRVILEVMHARLMEQKVHTWTRRLLEVYDELPAYGYMSAVEKDIAVEGSYGIRTMAVVQDLEQLWDTYGTTTQIWGNAAIKVWLTLANDLTAKRVSDNLLGQGTIENPVAQQSPIMGRKTSVSLQHVGRDLLTTEEVMHHGPTREIITIVDQPPIEAERCNYRTDPNFAGRWEKGGEEADEISSAVVESHLDSRDASSHGGHRGETGDDHSRDHHVDNHRGDEAIEALRLTGEDHE